MGRRVRRCRDESGSATVLALGVIVAVLTVTIGGLAVLGVLRAAHVARSSADLAALAAAGDFQQHADPVRACARARRVARGQAARLVGCSVDVGGIASVTTSVPISHRLAGVGPEVAEGQALAGPG
ncbi:Rv3654c family TadE-like protein [Janibacter cremeus]|uniref:Secretion/DNA translocation related TadE-like protein n=1 Tax=Janibacter cremeus TaxID=1285192 RepID=A0A852VWX4_9MICO|nr:secretion/DNA translocation related TadE-like protein [Janibacter cremeus]